MYVYIYLFIYLWLHWVLVAARGLSLVAMSGGHSSLQCTGLSLQRPLLLQSMGSRRVGFSSWGMWALEHRLSRCGTRAQLLHGMWDPPRPGIEPVSPALAGRFSTTVPPGKPLKGILFQRDNLVQFSFLHKVYQLGPSDPDEVFFLCHFLGIYDLFGDLKNFSPVENHKIKNIDQYRKCLLHFINK